MQLRWGGRCYSRYVRWSVIVSGCKIEKNVKIGELKPKILQKHKSGPIFLGHMCKLWAGHWVLKFANRTIETDIFLSSYAACSAATTICPHPLQWRLEQTPRAASVFEFLFLPARRSKRGICYGNVSWLGGWLAGWLGGWLSVTRRYCIKTAKPIWKGFRPPESTIILISWDPCANTQFHGEPLQRGR